MAESPGSNRVKQGSRFGVRSMKYYEEIPTTNPNSDRNSSPLQSPIYLENDDLHKTGH